MTRYLRGSPQLQQGHGAGENGAIKEQRSENGPIGLSLRACDEQTERPSMLAR